MQHLYEVIVNSHQPAQLVQCGSAKEAKKLMLALTSAKKVIRVKKLV
jgi:hypothetical protein